MLVLIVDLGTELGPAFSYSFEPPEGDIMLVPPRKVLTTAAKAHGQTATLSDPPAGIHGWFIKKWHALQAAFYREETGEVLVDNELLCWSYLQGGLIESAGCFGAYLAVLAWEGVPLRMLFRSAITFFKGSSPPLLLTNGTMVRSAISLLLDPFLCVCVGIRCRSGVDPGQGRSRLLLGYRHLPNVQLMGNEAPPVVPIRQGYAPVQNYRGGIRLFLFIVGIRILMLEWWQAQ